MLTKTTRLLIMFFAAAVLLTPALLISKSTFFEPIVYWFFSKETKATVTKACTYKEHSIRRVRTTTCSDVGVTFKANNKNINAIIDKYYLGNLGIGEQINIRYSILNYTNVMITGEARLFVFLMALIPNLMVFFLDLRDINAYL